MSDLKQTIYLLQKEGVYPQGIYGTFDNPEDAIAAANEAAKHDIDAYHAWVVIEAPTFNVERVRESNELFDHRIYCVYKDSEGKYIDKRYQKESP